ncbi:MAG: carbohydrate ABC transporter permease [Anaerolineae bacterium]|nr:carbohydrate ABC transporter permease [Anaerolineae bacterium]
MARRSTSAIIWDVINRIMFTAVIILILLFTLLPFLYAISISFRTNAQVLIEARYTPEAPNLINYQNLFTDPQFLGTLRNSALVSSVTVIAALVIGSFAAYALGRVRFRGRMAVMYVVLAMTMFPQISILSGLFAIIRDLNIYGTTLSLMFTYPIFTLPFTVWVLTGFFQGLPEEIEQAALVDGATPFQTFWMVLVPLTAPALVTTGLLAFISAWNEYLFALTFTLINPAAHTVPVLIANFSGYSYEVPIADRIAAAVVVTVPLIILVLVFQRRIIEGLTAGAVKG